MVASGKAGLGRYGKADRVLIMSVVVWLAQVCHGYIVQDRGGYIVAGRVGYLSSLHGWGIVQGRGRYDVADWVRTEKGQDEL